MANPLAVDIAGLKLKNPTMLAAGILGMSGASMLEVIRNGAGAVVTKSLGLKPRKGYANPTVVQVDCGLLNAIGLPNPSVDRYAEEIQEIKQSKVDAPVIVSVYGFSANDFAEVARKAERMGADAVELNVSCPHVERTGCEIGQDPKLVAEVVKKVKAAIEKPVILKLTPNVADIGALAEAGAKAGADAITAINTVRAMKIDIETAWPVLANKFGGLSGPAIKPIAVRCVYEIYERVKTPIIGCGGVTTWEDAVEFLLAGASAVQIGSAIAWKDLGLFNSVNRGIDRYLRMKGFRSVKDIVGLSHRR
jgi:dihydroorotate dehydrogenase (NAD+) catalytic subunit